MDSILSIRNPVLWFSLIILILALDLRKCCTPWMKVSLVKFRTFIKLTVSVFVLLNICLLAKFCQISVTHVEWFVPTRSSKKQWAYLEMFVIPFSLFPLSMDSVPWAKFCCFLLYIGLLCFCFGRLLFTFRNIRDALPLYCLYKSPESTFSVEIICFLIW